MSVLNQKSCLYITFSISILLTVLLILHHERDLTFNINGLNNYNDYRSRSLEIDAKIVPARWGCGSRYEWSSYLNKLFTKYEAAPSVPFYGSIIQNIDRVSNLLITVEDRYLKPLSLDTDGFIKLQSACHDDISEFPVFVTGCSADYYTILQALFQNIDENVRVKYKDIKVIFYDLGLKKDQRQLVEDYCVKKSGCEFRIFKFDQYPDHVQTLTNFAFKPIIIQEVLIDYDFVFWLDVSIRLTGNGLEELFYRTKERGIQVLPNDGPIAQRTGKPTFNSLDESPLVFLFYEEIGAGAITVVRNKFTMNAILKPWTICALYYGCMAYNGSEIDRIAPCKRRFENAISVHNCHRFDQSALGIILTRLYIGHQYLVKMDFKPKLQEVLDVQRGHSATYFCKLFNIKQCS